MGRTLAPSPTAACAICQAVFYASPGHLRDGQGKYCSLKCRSAGMSGPGNGRWLKAGATTCQGCGLSFHRKPSAHGSIATYCSVACVPKLKQVRACVVCKRSFETFPSTDSNFCSPECAATSRRVRVKRKCIECGDEFSCKPSEITAKTGAGAFCSNDCKHRRMSHSPKTVIGVARGVCRSGGKRADLADRYFRSSWEANYARYLNWLQARKEIDRWEYEVDTFEFPVRRGSKFYTPDFKIFEGEFYRYVEVKGWMNQESKTKLNRMRIHFPKERVDVVGAKEIASIRSAVGPMIPMWEHRKK